MTLAHEAFKAYDVRGVYPTEIDEDGARAIGRALVAHLNPRTVVVGRDMRTMARSVGAALQEGILDAGADVIDLGMVGTEMLYFAVASLQADAGVQVTASHNPAEYIGMKVVRTGAQPVGSDSGLMDVRDLALAGGAPPAGRSRGTVREHDVVPAYNRWVLDLVDPAAMRPLTVVLDAANGLGGVMADPLLAGLPFTTHAYNFNPDGTFPNHEPNPLLEENRQFIMAKVLEHKADLGIAWDGDADRCFFIDDTGEFVPGDFITALLARLALRRTPGATVLYDVRASRAVPDTIEQAGGVAIASRVGHAFIKQRIRTEGAVFAGEVSGHYYFRDFFGVDTGMVPALMLLQLVSESGGKLSTLLEPLRTRYFISGEINTRVDDVAGTLDRIRTQYADARISEIDGVSVDYEDWHFNVRPSNTEPLLRLNLEAFSQQEMEQRRDEVLDLIHAGSTAAAPHGGTT